MKDDAAYFNILEEQGKQGTNETQFKTKLLNFLIQH